MIITPFERKPGDYARKINLGVTLTDEPLIFLGADDLKFHNAWFELALRQLKGHIGVVGTNDMGSRRAQTGQHSTHSLVTRTYIEKFGTIDELGKALHEGYDHNFVDDELVQTAKYRRAWASARDSHVEHLHPHWRKGSQDETYILGRRQYAQDREYFNSRCPLWGQTSQR